MILHKNLQALPEFKNAVITIGSYDGVHAGHQEIINRVRSRAKEINGESILITFDPHPRFVLTPDDQNLKLISTIKEKTSLLEQFGIDHLVIAPFTLAFARQSPETYIRDFLVKKFNPKIIVIGYDHRFGKNRKGNIDMLKAKSEIYGYQVEEIPKKEITDIAVSSTKVRNAIISGDLETATRLMKHPFVITGKVIKGRQLGQVIGFPTANIELEHPAKILPSDGVYAVLVHYLDKMYKAMLYIGRSLNNKQKTVEVNIFDFNRNIYEEELTIEFRHKVRDDMRFDGIEDLKIQLFKDKDHTINLLQEFN